MQIHVLIPLLSFALAALLPQAGAVLSLGGNEAKRSAPAPRTSSWMKHWEAAIAEIHQRGAGGYSTADAAHDALHAAFGWHERSGRLQFNPAGARPSFCSGAVYAALLSALAKWDAAQPRPCIQPEAWQALAPSRVADGVGAWGWANANGPGYAQLIHHLGAGFNFTEMAKARPGDVMKIWWNGTIGASERGHLVIFVQDEGDSLRVWSSHQPTETEPGGFGFRSYPKSSIRRALFTRITKPAAFNNAPSIGEDAWLMGLMQRNTSWAECLRRCGIPH